MALQDALHAQACRRGLVLPVQLGVPSDSWVAGYRDAARDSTLPAQLHTLPGARAVASHCLTPCSTPSSPAELEPDTPTLGGMTSPSGAY